MAKLGLPMLRNIALTASAAIIFARWARWLNGLTLPPNDVFRRLSDIVDGDFAKPGLAGHFELTSTLVAHALGAALLDHLGEPAQSDRDSVEKKLADWLDPIAELMRRRKS